MQNERCFLATYCERLRVTPDESAISCRRDRGRLLRRGLGRAGGGNHGERVRISPTAGLAAKQRA